LHVFKGEILANMTQVSDVAHGPLVFVSSNGLPYLVPLTTCKGILRVYSKGHRGYGYK
jgi:hypothetical protein